MKVNRWQSAKVERGKPRVYIQQYFDLRLPEEEYLRIAREMGQEKPFSEEAAAGVMEAFMEELDDGSQFDAVHLEKGDGLVMLMTVVSFPYRQETYDRLMAEHLARRAIGAE